MLYDRYDTDDPSDQQVVAEGLRQEVQELVAKARLLLHGPGGRQPISMRPLNPQRAEREREMELVLEKAEKLRKEINRLRQGFSVATNDPRGRGPVELYNLVIERRKELKRLQHSTEGYDRVAQAQRKAEAAQREVRPQVMERLQKAKQEVHEQKRLHTKLQEQRLAIFDERKRAEDELKEARANFEALKAQGPQRVARALQGGASDDEGPAIKHLRRDIDIISVALHQDKRRFQIAERESQSEIDFAKEHLTVLQRNVKEREAEVEQLRSQVAALKEAAVRVRASEPPSQTDSPRAASSTSGSPSRGDALSRPPRPEAGMAAPRRASAGPVMYSGIDGGKWEGFSRSPKAADVPSSSGLQPTSPNSQAAESLPGGHPSWPSNMEPALSQVEVGTLLPAPVTLLLTPPPASNQLSNSVDNTPLQAAVSASADEHPPVPPTKLSSRRSVLGAPAESSTKAPEQSVPGTGQLPVSPGAAGAEAAAAAPATQLTPPVDTQLPSAAPNTPAAVSGTVGSSAPSAAAGALESNGAAAAKTTTPPPQQQEGAAKMDGEEVSNCDPTSALQARRPDAAVGDTKAPAANVSSTPTEVASSSGNATSIPPAAVLQAGTEDAAGSGASTAGKPDGTPTASARKSLAGGRSSIAATANSAAESKPEGAAAGPGGPNAQAKAAAPPGPAAAGPSQAEASEAAPQEVPTAKAKSKAAAAPGPPPATTEAPSQAEAAEAAPPTAKAKAKANAAPDPTTATTEAPSQAEASEAAPQDVPTAKAKAKAKAAPDPTTAAAEAPSQAEALEAASQDAPKAKAKAKAAPDPPRAEASEAAPQDVPKAKAKAKAAPDPPPAEASEALTSQDVPKAKAKAKGKAAAPDPPPATSETPSQAEDAGQGDVQEAKAPPQAAKAPAVTADSQPAAAKAAAKPAATAPKAAPKTAPKAKAPAGSEGAAPGPAQEAAPAAKAKAKAKAAAPVSTADPP